MKSDKMKTAAIIVTYYPNKYLKVLVNKLLRQANRTIIIDNSPNTVDVIEQLERMNHSNIEIVRLGHNTGIAHALNMGIEKAAECDLILTLDQDSNLPEDYISRMVAFFEAYQSEGRLGLVAPNFVDVNSGTAATFTRLERFSMQSFTCAGTSGMHETTLAITSGSVIPRAVFAAIGGFETDLFIDQVDFEFCLRLQQHGYRALINASVTIEHAIGQREKHRFLGLTFKPNNHGPLRRYYISRNGLYVAKKYMLTYPSFIALNVMKMIHEVGCVVLYERNKRSKLSAIALGLWDGLIGKLGKWDRVAH
jgi:rhamnosyltransferase